MAARSKHCRRHQSGSTCVPSPRVCTCCCLQLLAKELVHTRKATTRLYTNKAHMMNMSAQLTEQLGIAKVAGTLNKSTVVSMRQALHCSCLVADTTAAAMFECLGCTLMDRLFQLMAARLLCSACTCQSCCTG